jgi:hypothetical protein
LDSSLEIGDRQSSLASTSCSHLPCTDSHILGQVDTSPPPTAHRRGYGSPLCKTSLPSPQNGAFLPAKQCFSKENNIFSDKFSIGNYVFSEIMLFFAA